MANDQEFEDHKDTHPGWYLLHKLGQNPLTFVIPAALLTYLEYKLDTNAIMYSMFGLCVVMTILTGHKIGEWKLPYMHKTPAWFQRIMKPRTKRGE